jgi:ATP-dependent Lon protease
MTKRKPDDSVCQEKKKRVRKNSKDILWVNNDPPPSEPIIIEPVPTQPVPIDPKPEIITDSDSTTSFNTEEYREFVRAVLQDYIDDALPEYVEEEPEPEPAPPPRKAQSKPKAEKPVMKLNHKENTYFKGLDVERQKELNIRMKEISTFLSNDTDIPLRFQVMDLPVSDFVKATVLKKIDILEDQSGETYKVRNWVDAFLRIPFGKIIPVPVSLSDGRDKCSAFMRKSRESLDKATYGLVPAKTQILQILAQWIASPGSVGNVIALQGPAGTGKTTLARKGIAEALQRPFEFFSLGGASDIANFIGHSYTYEGSMWGRIADSVMHAKCMNPVLYFDELDKISSTPQGDEITNLLIHLTDRSQNSQFHDRYFAGLDLDLSQCLFVFSFNDLNNVNPILRDRMQVIQCSGYSEADKKCILRDYVWPGLLERLCFKWSDIELPNETIEYLISEFSSQEKGVRTLIRTAETIITRLNMLRIADESVMKDYKFYVDVTFPLLLTTDLAKTLLYDTVAKEPELWRSMYN